MSRRHAHDPSGRQSTDVIGLLLISCLAGWVWLSAVARQGAASATISSLAILGIGYVVGRVSARQPAVMATLGFLLLTTWVLTTRGSFEGGPLAGPLGYANANAALAVQIAGIALVAAARLRSTAGRFAIGATATVSLALTAVNHSAAGMALGAVLLIVGVLVLMRPPKSPTPAAIVAGVLVALVVGAQCLIALGVGDGTATRTLSGRRVALWADALELARSQPVLGHGPGSFAITSPVAAADSDTRAAHSTLLETAAETGLVGACLLVMVVAWAFYALARASDAGPAVIGVAAWTAFCLHALVDYVADFPHVLFASAFALGLAIGPYSQKSSMSPSVSDQPSTAGA